MRTFQVARRQTEESYWLQATSHSNARRLVALNAPGAADAEKAEAFVCLVDPQRRPGLGFIINRNGQQFSITHV